jgi:hypothetical protein
VTSFGLQRGVNLDKRSNQNRSSFHSMEGVHEAVLLRLQQAANERLLFNRLPLTVFENSLTTRAGHIVFLMGTNGFSFILASKFLFRDCIPLSLCVQANQTESPKHPLYLSSSSECQHPICASLPIAKPILGLQIPPFCLLASKPYLRCPLRRADPEPHFPLSYTATLRIFNAPEFLRPVKFVFFDWPPTSRSPRSSSLHSQILHLNEPIQLSHSRAFLSSNVQNFGTQVEALGTCPVISGLQISPSSPEL